MTRCRRLALYSSSDHLDSGQRTLCCLVLSTPLLSPTPKLANMSFLGRGSAPTSGGINQDRVDMATQECVHVSAALYP